MHIVRSLTPSEWENPNEESSRNQFDENIHKRFVDPRYISDNWINRRHNTGEPFQHEDELSESDPEPVPNNIPIYKY